MSDSPQSNPKDVEQGAPSPDEDAQPQMNDPTDPHQSRLTYEFEVKEQDRWLPIANGTSSLFLLCSLPMIRLRASWASPIEACASLACPSTPLCRWRRFRLACWRAAHTDSSMPGHSTPRAPQSRRASSSKSDKGDVYDANIRNFAPVARIMKNALPENAKIAKEAKECMQECVSEFISFITSEGEPLSCVQ